MLDRWFMKYLTPRGILWYFLGQGIFVGILALILFGQLSLDTDTAFTYLIIGLLPFMLIWGFICRAIWPKQEES